MNLAEIKRHVDAAPYGAKRREIEKLAKLHGVSANTLYRNLAEEFGRKRSRKASPLVPDEVIDLIAMKKAFQPKNREYTTEDALQDAMDEGLIEQGSVSVSTINRRLRENGFRKQKPVQRFLETFSNQAHYLDFSRSEYISLIGYDADRGEYILKLDTKSLRYKNKQGPAFSLWVAGMRDGRSGLFLAKYYTVTGENTYMGLDFLQHCWGRENDDHPLNCFPYYLKSDNGALAVNAYVQRMLEALDIELQTSVPGNKNAQGKIERMWRTLWQRFELRLVMRRGIGATLYLDELNEMVFEYCLRDADRPHSIYPSMTRRQLYETELIGYPPRIYEGDISNLASKPRRCKVGKDLKFRYENQFFSAPERYYDKWVLVHKNLQGDLIAEGEHDGELFEISDWHPNEFGDYKAFPDTYREQMEKQAIRNFQVENGGKNVRLKPVPEKIRAKSPHLRERQDKIFTEDQARRYIARQLHVDSYAEVAQWFDELLSVRLDKAAIDEALRAMKRAI